MTIEWIAHSCFKITLEDGRVILFDPFDSAIGYTMPEISADVVLISHDHYDHNCTDSLRGDYVLIREAGVTELEGIRVEGIPTYHDHEKGAKRGRNIHSRAPRFLAHFLPLRQNCLLCVRWSL